MRERLLRLIGRGSQRHPEKPAAIPPPQEKGPQKFFCGKCFTDVPRKDVYGPLFDDYPGVDPRNSVPRYYHRVCQFEVTIVK